MSIGRPRALTTATALAVGLLLTLVPAALATGHGRLGAAAEAHPVTAHVDHRFQGIIPSSRALGHRGRPMAKELAGSTLSSVGNLRYWGGPVMTTNTTYTIYWEGSSSLTSGYESLINGFFGNVAAAQNASTNVYAVGTQYYGPANSHVSNQSSFGGSAVDNSPIPDDCSAEYAGTGISVSGCVTDADIQAEVARVAKAQGWPLGLNDLFFVFTPQNVGSCFDTTSGQCSYTYYCAYHSSFTNSANNEVLYSDVPYSQISGAPGACDSGQSPNGDPAADDAINLISHEHNEAITDPEGNAWYDSSGNEIGDKCAWNFGSGPWPSTGAATSSEYNQHIGTGYYYLQQEWSNASTGCALNYSPPAPATLAVTGFSPTRAAAGSTVTITGTNFARGDSVYFNGIASSLVSYVSSTQLRATVPNAASNGPITVSASGGSPAASPGSFLVIPTLSSFSPSSAAAGKTVTLTGSGFQGATSVAFNGVAAVFTVVSANTITATVPAAARTGRIAVTTPGGTTQSRTSFTITH